MLLSSTPNEFKNNAHPANYSTRNCILPLSAAFLYIYTLRTSVRPGQTAATAAASASGAMCNIGRTRGELFS